MGTAVSERGVAAVGDFIRALSTLSDAKQREKMNINVGGE
jgi:hypothetical protein